jgi:hypothetical protein
VAPPRKPQPWGTTNWLAAGSRPSSNATGASVDYLLSHSGPSGGRTLPHVWWCSGGSATTREHSPCTCSEDCRPPAPDEDLPVILGSGPASPLERSPCTRPVERRATRIRGDQAGAAILRHWLGQLMAGDCIGHRLLDDPPDGILATASVN